MALLAVLAALLSPAFAASAPSCDPLLLKALGLPGAGPAMEAFAGAASRAKVDLSLSGRSADEDAARIQRAMGDYASSLEREIARLRASARHGNDAKLERAVEDMSRLTRALPALPASMRERALDAARDAREALYQARLDRAIAKVRAAGAWSRWDSIASEARALAAPLPMREALDAHLADHAEALAAVGAGQLLMGEEEAAQAPARRARARRLRQELASAPDPLAFALHQMTGGEPLSSKDRALMEALRSYVPSLDPSMAVAGHPSFDLYVHSGRALGWANQYSFDQDPQKPRGFISIQMSGGLNTMIHEGFHQGDVGYGQSLAAMQLLLGKQQGAALWSALVEGYTQWRTQKATERILDDVFARKPGPSQVLARWIWDQYGFLKTEEKIRKFYRRRFRSHVYGPYVRLIDSIMRKDGGREALDRFVLDGDITGIASLAGKKRLTAMGELAGFQKEIGGEVAGRKPVYAAPLAVRLALYSGLTDWLDNVLNALFNGRLGPARAEVIQKRARGFLDAASRSLDPEDDLGTVLIAIGWSKRRFDRLLSPTTSAETASYELERVAADMARMRGMKSLDIGPLSTFEERQVPSEAASTD